MSGALGKKMGLIVTSAKKGDGARVYRINPGRGDPKLVLLPVSPSADSEPRSAGTPHR